MRQQFVTYTLEHVFFNASKNIQPLERILDGFFSLIHISLLFISTRFTFLCHNKQTIELIQNLIAFLVAYFPTVTIAGYFESWVAKKAGDNTPEDEGYLTLNPITHMDPIGIAILTIPPHFGFGSKIPVNIHNITNPYKNLKLLFVYFSRSLAHFGLAVFSLFLIIIFQYKLLKGFNFLTVGQLPPLALSIRLVLKALLNLNILSSLLYFLIGFIRYFIHFFLPDLENRSGFMNLLIFLFPFLLILVLGPYIEQVLRIFLVHINYIFDYLLK